jgi:hypothetical protein
MDKRRSLFGIAVSVLLIAGSVSPSWAWRGGWGGPRVGVYLGGGPWWGGPYWDDPYYSDPYPAYYYPYAYYPSYPYYPYYPPVQSAPQYAPQQYAPPPQATPQTTQASPDNSRRDPRFLVHQIVGARGQINYEYQDGDISQSFHDGEIRRLAKIEDEARTDVKANGGYLTADQERALLQQLRGSRPTE